MRIVFAVVISCLLVSAGWVAAQQAQAQFKAPAPIPQDIRTGSEFGFRVNGTTRDGRITGTLVVRTKDGTWVEAHPEPSHGFVVPVDGK